MPLMERTLKPKRRACKSTPNCGGVRFQAPRLQAGVFDCSCGQHCYRNQVHPSVFTTYAHATWHRLAPFFRLPGCVTHEKQTVTKTVCPINDAQLNRALQAVCEEVE